MRKIIKPIALASAVLLTGCASNSNRDIGYAVQETILAPISFVVGGIKDIAKDPFQGTYNLTGRAVSEGGRIVNGATHMFTGNRYEAEFGSARIHPLADNNTVKLAGWGAIGGYFGGKTLLGLFSGLAAGLGLDYFDEQGKK